MKNTDYTNWHKPVIPPDYVACKAKGHCLLKKLTLKSKHDCQQVQLKFLLVLKTKIWQHKIIIVMNSELMSHIVITVKKLIWQESS